MNRKHLVVILLALSLATVQCRRESEEPEDLNFILTFKNAQDLRPGQFIVYRGTRIGTVTQVDVDASGVKVSVNVDAGHRALVYKEAKFTIEKLTFLNPTGEHQVVMEDAGDVKTPVEKGTVITGNEGWLGAVSDSVKGAATSAAHAAAQLVGESNGTPPNPEPATATH